MNAPQTNGRSFECSTLANQPSPAPWQTSTAATHIEVSVVSTSPVNGTCPNPNGGSAVSLRRDDSLDTHKRIKLDYPLTFSYFAGQCYHAVDVPNGADGLPRGLIYRADYWENNDAAPFEME